MYFFEDFRNIIKRIFGLDFSFMRLRVAPLTHFLLLLHIFCMLIPLMHDHKLVCLLSLKCHPIAIASHHKWPWTTTVVGGLSNHHRHQWWKPNPYSTSTWLSLSFSFLGITATIYIRFQPPRFSFWKTYMVLESLCQDLRQTIYICSQLRSWGQTFLARLWNFFPPSILQHFDSIFVPNFFI